MLRLPSFAFHAPKTVEEAAALLAEDPAGTKLVAGGTDLWPNLKRRHQSASRASRVRSCGTPARSAATSASTPAAPTTTRTKSGAAASTTA